MMCIDVRGRILVFIVVVFDRKDIFFYFLDEFKYFFNVKCEDKLIIKCMKRDLGKLEIRNYYFKCCRKELVL